MWRKLKSFLFTDDWSPDFAIPGHWRMRRRVRGRWQYRAMTADEIESHYKRLQSGTEFPGSA
jgi:hypothetical protein